MLDSTHHQNYTFEKVVLAYTEIVGRSMVLTILGLVIIIYNTSTESGPLQDEVRFDVRGEAEMVLVRIMYIILYYTVIYMDIILNKKKKFNK